MKGDKRHDNKADGGQGRRRQETKDRQNGAIREPRNGETKQDMAQGREMCGQKKHEGAQFRGGK